LIDAMKETGFLAFKRGRGFFYPGWKETITGLYAARREGDRVRKDRERRERQTGVATVHAHAQDVRGRGVDASADSPRTSLGNPGERKEQSLSEPPDPPPAGGDSVADARWDWINQKAPTPQGRDSCRRILAIMSDADWALVQRAYGLLHDPAVSLSRRDRRVLQSPTDVFLRKQAFLRFRPIERPSRTSRRPPTLVRDTTPVDEFKRRLAARDEFVMALVRDPDESETAKAEAKRR
jgi:hypothetical protein